MKKVTAPQKLHFTNILKLQACLFFSREAAFILYVSTW